MAKNDGGPAFPRTENISDEHNGPLCSAQEGMSLRDYFAAQCIVGNINWVASAEDLARTAKCAYELADALLAARTVGTDGN